MLRLAPLVSYRDALGILRYEGGTSLVLPSPTLDLRALLTKLTDALESRAADDVITLDVHRGVAVVRSSLDEAEARVHAVGITVLAPDGRWEWGVRRDFVRSLAASPAKRRLGDTLAGPTTRARFVRALDAVDRDGSHRARFRRFRRRRLRTWAAQVIRWAYAVTWTAVVRSAGIR